MSSRHAWRSLRFWFDALFHPEPLETLPPEPARKSERRGLWSLLFAIEPLTDGAQDDAPEPEPRRLKLLRYLLLPESLERSTERDESARR